MPDHKNRATIVTVTSASGQTAAVDTRKLDTIRLRLKAEVHPAADAAQCDGRRQVGTG